jgi:hypothetical protein
MSWLFSRALVGASLGGNFLDGTQSAQSSGTPTPQAYCAPDKMTDFSRPSRFGMTFGHLTEGHGEAVLMWCLADSLAKTSASQERATASTESEAASGRKWHGSLAKYDHDSRSWKTAQPCLLGGSEEFLETWPRWGTTVAGALYLLPMPVLRTSGTGCGSLPTPLYSWGKRGPGVSNNLDNLRNSLGTTRECLAIVKAVGWRWPASFLEWMMGWPVQWTALRPLETDSAHKPQPSPGAA